MIRTISKFLEINRRVLTKISVLVLLCFGISAYLNYSVDTYYLFGNGFRETAKEMTMLSGRPVISLMYYIHWLYRIPDEVFYYFSKLGGYLFLVAAVWLYQKQLEEYIVLENQRIVLTFVCIANIYIIEYFLFIETIVFMFGIFMNVLAVYFLKQYFKARDRRMLLFAVSAMLPVAFAYQGMLSLYAILSLPIVWKESKNIWAYCHNLVAVMIPYTVSAIAIMITFKFLITPDRFHEAGLTKAITELLPWIIEEIIWNSVITFNIMPVYFYATLTGILIILNMTVGIRNSKPAAVAHTIMVVLIACALPFAAHLQGSGFSLPRTIYPHASLFGILAVQLGMVLGSENQSRPCAIWKLCLFVVGLLLLVQALSFNRLFLDRYECNELDQYRCEYVAYRIKKYETESGNKVENVVFYNDAETKMQTYPNLYYREKDMVGSVFNRKKSNFMMLNYHLGTDYTAADKQDEYEEYFQSHNWDSLSEDQLIFDGNTLHICAY